MRMNQAMPGGFVRDSRYNSAMQDAVSVQKFTAQGKIDGNAVAMFSNHA
jgi:hypothetical protein